MIFGLIPTIHASNQGDVIHRLILKTKFVRVQKQDEKKHASDVLFTSKLLLSTFFFLTIHNR
jgi:hypothetical protein